MSTSSRNLSAKGIDLKQSGKGPAAFASSMMIHGKQQGVNKTATVIAIATATATAIVIAIATEMAIAIVIAIAIDIAIAIAIDIAITVILAPVRAPVIATLVIQIVVVMRPTRASVQRAIEAKEASSPVLQRQRV